MKDIKQVPSNDSPNVGLDRIYRIWDEYGYFQIEPDPDVGNDNLHLKRYERGENGKASSDVCIPTEHVPLLIIALTEILALKKPQP